MRARPHVYACTHLANSASLLLPVSNLTNLLAFAASGLAFGRFAALMALPWLAAIGVEYAVFGRFFASDLGAGSRARPDTQDGGAEHAGVHGRGGRPHPRRVRGRISGRGEPGLGRAGRRGGARGTRAGPAADQVRWAWYAPPTRRSLLFVLGLAIVVAAVVGNGLGTALRPLLPAGTSLSALLAIAALAAVLANVATTCLPCWCCAADRPRQRGAVLAVLVGVNIGPNLTYRLAGDAAVAPQPAPPRGSAGPRGIHPARVLAVPAGLVVAVLALWAGLRVMGG